MKRIVNWLLSTWNGGYIIGIIVGIVTTIIMTIKILNFTK